MIEYDFVNGEDRKSAFPARSIVTIEFQHPGPINGQATLNKYEILSSPVHEALHLTWDKVKYCGGGLCTSSSNDQKVCKTTPEEETTLRRHPSYLQRDAFLSSTFSDDCEVVPDIPCVNNTDCSELNKCVNE